MCALHSPDLIRLHRMFQVDDEQISDDSTGLYSRIDGISDKVEESWLVCRASGWNSLAKLFK